MRLWAQGSPIETKDLLKARRYRWSGARRCWYIDLEEDQIEIERSYLSEIIFRRPCGELPVDRFTARDRFSARTNPEFELLRPSGHRAEPASRPSRAVPPAGQCPLPFRS